MNATRKQFQFFLQNAGYSTPPGRAACALALAEAESLKDRMVEDGQWQVKWQQDRYPDVSWMDAHQLRAYEQDRIEMLECLIINDRGQVLASLCGVSIYSNERNYLRVVEAELAQEAQEYLEHQAA